MDPHDKAIIHGSVEANYRTPGDCYKALDGEFKFAIDFAADRASALCPEWLGPGSPHGTNALAVDWADLLRSTAFDHLDDPRACPPGFINPPFSKTLVNAYNTGRIKVDGKWVEHEKNPEKAKAYDIENWAEKCWRESQRGALIVGIFPFTPQTEWYRNYVYGHELQQPETEVVETVGWSGHAAREERRLPHRISFLQPDGTPTGNAGVNSAIIVWKPNPGIVGPWQPHQFYWSYR